MPTMPSAMLASSSKYSKSQLWQLLFTPHDAGSRQDIIIEIAPKSMTVQQDGSSFFLFTFPNHHTRTTTFSFSFYLLYNVPISFNMIQFFFFTFCTTQNCPVAGSCSAVDRSIVMSARTTLTCKYLYIYKYIDILIFLLH